ERGRTVALVVTLADAVDLQNAGRVFEQVPVAPVLVDPEGAYGPGSCEIAPGRRYTQLLVDRQEGDLSAGRILTGRHQHVVRPVGQRHEVGWFRCSSVTPSVVVEVNDLAAIRSSHRDITGATGDCDETRRGYGSAGLLPKWLEGRCALPERKNPC